MHLPSKRSWSCVAAVATSLTVLYCGPAAAQADVTVSQMGPAAPVPLGKDLKLLLIATNNGPDAATGIRITDTLPSGTPYVWATPPCQSLPPQVRCPVSLPAGQSAIFELIVRPGQLGPATNTLTVTADQADPNPGNNSHTLIFDVTAGPPATPIVRYRLYSDVTKEHHFTTDLNEYDTLGTYVGTWVQEGASGSLLDNPGLYNGVMAKPYYRLYNKASRRHHWTHDGFEYYFLGSISFWQAEGVSGYILPASAPGTTPLYRMRYPGHGDPLHHYTTDANEYTTLTVPGGWISEGVAGFVIQ